MSNGQAERFVDIFKRSIKKIDREGCSADAIQSFLLSYRATPNRQVPDNKSPAEVLLGRPIRWELDLLRNTDDSEFCDTAMIRQFNKHHGTRNRDFQMNDQVYYQDVKGNKQSWEPGTIVNRNGSVIYEVQTQNGIIRRHINQLRQRQSQDDILDELLDAFDILPKSNVHSTSEVTRTSRIPVPSQSTNSTRQVEQSTESQLLPDVQPSKIPVLQSQRYPVRN
ncbi:hypothetical protein NEOKW01_2141, partial [Nematocida sp. AWRm80]